MTVDCPRGPSSQPNSFVIVKLFIGDPGLKTCASTADRGEVQAEPTNVCPAPFNITSRQPEKFLSTGVMLSVRH